MGKIINIIGASGSGKTHVGRYLESIAIPEIISHTTREIRLNDNEINGSSYFFISKENFISMIENNELVEYTIYSGNYYGISKKEIENKLKDFDNIFAITEIEGHLSLKNIFKDDVITIYIDVPKELLKKRLIARGDSKESIKHRLSLIEEEFKNSKYADYIITNIDFDNTILEINKILNK